MKPQYHFSTEGINETLVSKEKSGEEKYPESGAYEYGGVFS